LKKNCFSPTASKRTKRGKQAENTFEDIEDTQVVDIPSDADGDEEEEPSRKTATKKTNQTKNVSQSMCVSFVPYGSKLNCLKGPKSRY